MTPQENAGRWEMLVEKYLPKGKADSIWRYRSRSAAGMPEQGWKLHVSATILTAVPILERIGPFLDRRGISFKAIVSLDELEKLNSGLYYSYTQIGKCFTVYPETDQEAVYLAGRLHALTRGMAAPAIPFDEEYRPGSCVYYRYGAFGGNEKTGSGDVATIAIRDPEGNLFLDRRDAVPCWPPWVSNPFHSGSRQKSVRRTGRRLPPQYGVVRALRQRGKGGVYQALDLSIFPPRPCLLKEGRPAGEIDWKGRDGRWRVERERTNLAALAGCELSAPQVYDGFELNGNYYLALEWIEGRDLLVLMRRRQRRFSVRRILEWGIQLAELISRMHAFGWRWGDCKPANLIVTPDYRLRPVDFEGAAPFDDQSSARWKTAAYAPPEWHAGEPSATPGADDLYALGVVLYFLLTGILPEPSRIAPVKEHRRGVPPATSQVVMNLLSLDPRERPAAKDVARLLASDFALMPERRKKSLSDQRTSKRSTRAAYLGSDRRSSKSGSTLVISDGG
jgi:hypothetical protein